MFNLAPVTQADHLSLFLTTRSQIWHPEAKYLFSGIYYYRIKTQRRISTDKIEGRAVIVIVKKDVALG